MKNKIKGLIVGLMIGVMAVGLGAQGDLSNQVLRLLTRNNYWGATQTFGHTWGATLERGTAPTITTDTIYNVGGNLYFNGVLVATSAGAGTVTSVALTVPAILSVSGSPITSSGTLAVTLATQSANIVFSGPSSGSAATPTFRALVDNDIPDTITINGTNNVTWASVNKSGSSLADLATKSASSLTSGTLPNAQFPANLPAIGGAALTTLNASALSIGTVPDAVFPATLPAASGTNLTSLNATNLSSGAVPAARMPALTGDITTSAGAVATTLAVSGVTASTYGDATHSVTIAVDAKGRITSASAPAITFPSVSLTSGVSGILPQANGGTGIDTSGATNGQILIGKTSDGSLTLATLTGTANQVVVSNGSASITLSLPQSINTSSTPQFARIGLGVSAGASALITGSGQDDRGYIAIGNCGSAKTIDWNSGEIQKTTLTAGSCALTLNNPIAGRTYRLDITQDASGSRGITWPGTVVWPSGVSPTLSAGASATDICNLRWDGSRYLGDCSLLNY